MKTNIILNGDALNELKTLPENSVDAIITDPPYGIGFMGKNWDTFKEGEKARQIDESKDKQKVVEKELYDASTGKMKKVRWVVPTGGRVAGTYDRSEEGIRGYQKWCKEWSKETLRILKPGGFMLVSCSTRMYHRLVCGIEDAGFEIRDTIMWLYGSGFPKSLNIGKQIDKRIKQEDPKRFGELCKKKREELGISVGEADKIINGGTGNYRIWIEGTHHRDKEPQRLPRWNEYLKIKELYKLDNTFDDLMKESEREFIKKEKNWGERGTVPVSGYGEFDVAKSKRDISKQWEGWGTALKPACEPIVVARKPLSEKNVALNVLKWGTGGINIDEGRIGTDKSDKNWRVNASVRNKETEKHLYGDYGEHNTHNLKEQGRFPSNIILDEEAGKMLDEQSGVSESKSRPPRTAKSFGETYSRDGWGDHTGLEHNDKGGASRFFYCAKASKSERNFGCEDFEDKFQVNAEFRPNHLEKAKQGDSGKPHGRYTPTKNNHPTVKPIRLMEYLIKLVSREGSIILDPFLGSGTTAIACLKLNRNFIGIEKEEEYVKIAQARIKPYLEQTKLK